MYIHIKTHAYILTEKHKERLLLVIFKNSLKLNIIDV